MILLHNEVRNMLVRFYEFIAFMVKALHSDCDVNIFRFCFIFDVVVLELFCFNFFLKDFRYRL